MRVLLLLIPFLLTGCSLARVNQSAMPDRALVLVGSLSTGEPSVTLRSIYSEHRILFQDIDRAPQISLRPGSYLVELECNRPGGSLFLHVFPEFRFSVEADRTYILDCSPGPAGDGFLLRERPNNSFKPKPLRGSA
jgi:hypothetical protein